MTMAAVSDPVCSNEVRRIPTPATEPPYDDDVDGQTVQGAAVQGALALAFHLPGGLPVEPAAPTLRLVAPPDPQTDPHYFGRQQTPLHALPDPRLFAGRLVQAMLEVAVAARPLGQLVRWTNEDVYRQLARQVRIAGHEDATSRRRLATGQVRSVRVSEPRGSLVEVCAVVQHRTRAAAIALRLEGVDGRWQCTAVQFG